MNCAQVRSWLTDPGGCRSRPEWPLLVVHTWECAGCRARLVAATVLAERLRAALQALPGPPPGLRAAILGADGGPPARRSARERLVALAPYLPLLLRPAADPLGLVRPWLRLAQTDR